MNVPSHPHLLTALVASGLLFTPGALRAQDATASGEQAQIDALRRQLQDQAAVLEELRRALGEQDARVRQLQQALEARQGGAAQPPGPPVADDTRTVRIGTAPAAPEPRLAVPQLFDQPSVLTPPGTTIVEPSLQYGYASNNRAALVGFTVLPALLIGLVDIREVRRNTTTAALTVRHGLAPRFELEARLPFVYRADSSVHRELFTGTATETAFEATGSGVGDFEVTGRYQLTSGGSRWPYLIGSLRLKTRTGKDPFEVVTDCVTRCVGGTTGSGEPLELPVGTGFYTLQPTLTWLYPSDPAVFFGNFSYAYNFARKGLSRQVLGGEREFLGELKPGDVIGMNFGMGLSINDRSSFSIGTELSSIGRARLNGAVIAGSARTQLASLLLGYSLRWDEKRTINLSVAAGLTRDTPDLTLTVRMPFAF